MNWNKDFINAFFCVEISEEMVMKDKKNIRRGYWLILKAQRSFFLIHVLWEFFTTFVMYAPATDIIKTILHGVSEQWNKMSVADQECVIMALRKMDRKGDITTTLKT